MTSVKKKEPGSWNLAKKLRESPLARIGFPDHSDPSLGWIAQLVEQRTENPRVGGSIPSPASFLL